MKQYTRKEIAKCADVVYLAVDGKQHEGQDKCMFADKPHKTPKGFWQIDGIPSKKRLPDKESLLGFMELHNPDQYPWPEPGQCVEYRMEPSLEEDLRELVSMIDKQIAQLDEISMYNLIYAGAVGMGEAYKAALEEIINKHYPES